jgi:hypothetical protein
VTPGTAEPCASTSLPLMFPVVCCAANGPATASTMSNIVTMVLRIFALASVFEMTGRRDRAGPQRSNKRTMMTGTSNEPHPVECWLLGPVFVWDEWLRQRTIQMIEDSPITFWIGTNCVTKSWLKRWLRGTNANSPFSARHCGAVRLQPAAVRPEAVGEGARLTPSRPRFSVRRAGARVRG